MAKAGMNDYYIQEKDKKKIENCKYSSSFSLDSMLSLEIATVGVDKQKARLHR